ncbi:hypothetical protein [Ruegeria meonggei]|nr:hypothetical protein [Ruegeria meonggei]
MPIIWSVLGYLAAVFVASLVFWGWQMGVFTETGGDQFVWVSIAASTLPLAIAATVIPAFGVRLCAVIMHQFNPAIAGIGGAITSVAVYLWLFSEDMTTRPLVDVMQELVVCTAVGAIAGLIWFWVENLGTTKE